MTSNWDVNAILQASFNLFKDSPARRADYVAIVDSNTFSTKFCLVRWVQNAAVASRALEVLIKLRSMCKRRQNLKSMCSDPSLLAKIAFFGSVAVLVEPYLKKLNHLHTFLYDDISSVI